MVCPLFRSLASPLPCNSDSLREKWWKAHAGWTLSVFAVIVGLSALPAPAAEGPAAAGPGAVGFAQEFAGRLAVSGNLAAAAAADGEDRAALARFYSDRQQEPIWTSATGLTPAGEAAIAEIRRADDWGLDAAAFQLPVLPAASGAELSRAARADAEIALSLAILKYARHARGGRAEPTSLSRNLDRKLPLLDPGQVIDQATKAASPTPICGPCIRSIRSSRRCARNTWP